MNSGPHELPVERSQMDNYSKKKVRLSERTAFTHFFKTLLSKLARLLITLLTKEFLEI